MRKELSGVPTENFGNIGDIDDMGERADDEPYVDAANRLERSLDRQIELIDGIDDKAEHVTRLVGLLIGAVFSLLSVAARALQIRLDIPNLPVQLSFFAGTAFLLVSMAGAIVTYLSSKPKIGLHHSAGALLNNPDYDADMDRHVRRVIGTYAYNLERNESVLETNAYRFRLTLMFLLLGVLYLAATGLLYLGGYGAGVSWASLVVLALGSVGIAWYILAGKYLTLEPGDSDNE